MAAREVDGRETVQRRCLEETRGGRGGLDDRWPARFSRCALPFSSVRDSNYAFHLPNAFRETAPVVARVFFPDNKEPPTELSPRANFPMLSAPLSFAFSYLLPFIARVSIHFSVGRGKVLLREDSLSLFEALWIIQFEVISKGGFSRRRRSSASSSVVKRYSDDRDVESNGVSNRIRKVRRVSFPSLKELEKEKRNGRDSRSMKSPFPFFLIPIK